MASLSEATAQFTLDLLRQVGGPDSDVFLSPVSIAVALAMTYAGADGTTAAQMKNTIFKGMKDDASIHAGFGEIIRALNQESKSYKLNTANRLYCQESYKVLEDYLNTLTKHYESTIKSVDFVANGENVRTEINKWVEEITRDKIKDLIAPGILTALTRLVIVNAIYFKGDWRRKFDEKQTFKQAFFSAPNRKIKVDMMHQKEDFLYHENDSVQVLGMPYKADLTMFVLLPKEKHGLAEMEKKLTGKELLSLVDSAYQMEVIVAIPKFRLEQSFSLNDALSKLGMTDMFDGNRADFSKMTGGKDLHVSAVIHKAFIEVNELGSEAAGATAVAMCVMSMPMEPETPKEFIADHPFLFAIFDQRNQSILFVGKFLGK